VNYFDQYKEALGILIWIVLFVASLGLAEIAVDIILAIVKKVKVMVG